MTELSAAEAPKVEARSHAAGAILRFVVIALTAFLTVVDLFATQAILPSLTKHYGVTPAAMGFAVNASTMGMAVSGLAVGYFSRSIDRRMGILLSLLVLSIPTALLAHAPDLTTFTLLRVAQGLCMAAAFTLTLAYLGEHYSAADSASAFAAYITGNVASNLIGRLISAAVADHFGLAANFYFFASLNLLGAALVYFTVEKAAPMKDMGGGMSSHFEAWIMHLKNPSLRASFAIGFCILFAFIGTFTFVNFVLVQPPLGVGTMTLGFVYFVFLPAVATTPLAGRAVKRFGTRPTFWAALAGGGARPAAAHPAEPVRRAARHGAGRRRHLLRPGHRHRLRRARRDLRSRLRERALSRQLLLRRLDRQRRARRRPSTCSAGPHASAASPSRFWRPPCLPFSSGRQCPRRRPDPPSQGPERQASGGPGRPRPRL